MKMFITASFNGGKNKEEIEKLCNLVRESGFEDFCFAKEKAYSDPIELMKKAKEDIKKCNSLLIDVTNKPTGRAYEAGIAFAYGIPVITILKKGTVINDTTKGISDIIIEYDKIEDITLQLKKYYLTLKGGGSN